MGDRSLTDRQLACLRAVAELEADPTHHGPVLAADVAARTKLSRGIRRHGHGARGPQSWSGRQHPAFHVGRTMRSLVDRGLVSEAYGHRSRGLYHTTGKGRQLLEESR